MARPLASIIFTVALPITLLGIMYYQHRRLLTAYPTLRVPPALKISARHDRAAFGMSQDGGGEPWRRTSSGDMWTAVVPRRLLHGTAEVAFALMTLARAGILFQTRGAELGVDDERTFASTARILGGLFVVEANDSLPVKRTEESFSPIVTSWWLRPLPESPTPRPIGVLGGYHSFAVQDIPSQPDTVQLCFVSHLILSSEPPEDLESIPTAELPDVSLRHRLLMHFHALYSRILVDFAVKRLRVGDSA
ncbi:hypothetical protein B0H10DRAFT_2014098 [Mycena sp. CBHHK59/15]|nr:hypothetical protein B0H10DRAFT_2014098 [Mycena sp. CBHHK59/15]